MHKNLEEHKDIKFYLSNFQQNDTFLRLSPIHIPKDIINMIDEYVNYDIKLFDNVVFECVNLIDKFLCSDKSSPILNKNYLVFRKIMYDCCVDILERMKFLGNLTSACINGWKIDFINSILYSYECSENINFIKLYDNKSLDKILFSYLELLLFKNYLIDIDMEKAFYNYHGTLNINTLVDISSKILTTLGAQLCLKSQNSNTQSRFAKFKISHSEEYFLLKRGFTPKYELLGSDRCWVLIGIAKKNENGFYSFRHPILQDQRIAIENKIHVYVKYNWLLKDIENLFLLFHMTK